MPHAVSEPMAKRTQDSDAKESSTTTTRVDKELIRKANVVAGSRRVSLFSYIADILRPQVESDYKKFIRGEAAKPD